MTSRHDPIPTLPPMRPSLRRRPRQRSYRPYLIGIIVIAVFALGAVAIAVAVRGRRLADEAFARAEQLFESGAFHKALEEYELFSTHYTNDHRVYEAKIGAELSAIAQTLDDADTNPQQSIESLDTFASRSHAEPSFKQRWPVILTMAHRSARAFLESANRSLKDADLESGDGWLRWLHEQQQMGSEGADKLELNTLDQLSAKGHEVVAVERRRRGFLDAADRAISDGNTTNFAEAFRAYERWQAEAKGPDSAIQAKFSKLQQALRAQIRFTQPPAMGETAPAIPQLPIGPYTLLSTNTQHKAIARSSERPVFARTKDLCFALDSATGQPIWVVRVGHDAPLPELTRRAGRMCAVVTWFNGETPMISLCDASSGESIWSWESPDPLTGPPAVTRDSIFVATRRGSLWHLDLEVGSVRGVAELPEPIDSPPTLREDGRGLCVVGARQAIYLFDTAREAPECSEIVLVGRRTDTARCQILWVPPYVIVFENDLVSRCYARVFFQESAGYRQVRQIELEGRVWQPPVLDGADILVVTDRWRTHCFGLDPVNSAVNLYTAATQIKPPGALQQPARPFATRQSEVPFVSLTDALYGYRADRAQGLIREVWSRPLPNTQSRSVQPLQVADGVIVATLEDPENGGTLVQAFSAGQGVQMWETRLGQIARDLSLLRVADYPDQFVARTDAGHVFVITRETEQQRSGSRLLGIPTPSSVIRQTGSAEDIVYACDGGAAIQVVSIRDWSRKGESLRSQPITSELAVYEGDLSIRSESARDSRRGRWVFYITADRSLSVRPLDSNPDEIHGARLPVAGSNDEPWRWAPVICGDSAIIAAHPRGVVCRNEVHQSDGILHLTVAEHRADLPPLLAAPVSTGEALLCVGRDGRCLALDPQSLRTRAEWQAPGPVQSAIAGTHQLWLCLEDSTVLNIRYQDGKLETNWQQQLSGSGWTLAEADQGRLLAVQSDGIIVPLDKGTGAAGTLIRVPAPLAVAPQLCGDQLVIATVDGGLHFVPVPQ